MLEKPNNISEMLAMILFGFPFSTLNHYHLILRLLIECFFFGGESKKSNHPPAIDIIGRGSDVIAQRVFILVFLILLSIPFFDSFFSILCYLFFSFHTWNGRKKTKEMSIKLPVYSERPRRFFLQLFFLTEKPKLLLLLLQPWVQCDILISTLARLLKTFFLLKLPSRIHLWTSWAQKMRSRLLETPKWREKKTFNFQLIFHSFSSLSLSLSLSLSPNRLPFNNETKKKTCAYIFLGLLRKWRRKHITKHRSIINILRKKKNNERKKCNITYFRSPHTHKRARVKWRKKKKLSNIRERKEKCVLL
jgi:hypothetical protein